MSPPLCLCQKDPDRLPTIRDTVKKMLNEEQKLFKLMKPCGSSYLKRSRPFFNIILSQKNWLVNFSPCMNLVFIPIRILQVSSRYPVPGIHVRERIRVKMRILLVWQNYADQKKHSDIDAFRKMQ